MDSKQMFDHLVVGFYSMVRKARLESAELDEQHQEKRNSSQIQHTWCRFQLDHEPFNLELRHVVSCSDGCSVRLITRLREPEIPKFCKSAYLVNSKVHQSAVSPLSAWATNTF